MEQEQRNATLPAVDDEAVGLFEAVHSLHPTHELWKAKPERILDALADLRDKINELLNYIHTQGRKRLLSWDEALEVVSS